MVLAGLFGSELLVGEDGNIFPSVGLKSCEGGEFGDGVSLMQTVRVLIM